MRPNSLTALSIMATHSASSATLAFTATMLPPMEATAASTASLCQSAATTLAPSATKSLAVARPMPDPAPVMTATLSLRRMAILI